MEEAEKEGKKQAKVQFQAVIPFRIDPSRE